MQEDIDHDAILQRLRNAQTFHDPARELLTSRSNFIIPAEHQRGWGFLPTQSEFYSVVNSRRRQLIGGVAVPFAAFPTWCRRRFGWRIWDMVSQSQFLIDGTLAFEAADVAHTLKSESGRQTALALHADWSNRVATPFISVFTNPRNAISRAEWQSGRRRGRVYVSLVDLQQRWEIGLPFVHAETEMNAYAVADPYHRNYQYYSDEALCLWAITRDEVAHEWAWEEISDYSVDQLTAESERLIQQHRDRLSSGQPEQGYEIVATPIPAEPPGLEQEMARLTVTSPMTPIPSTPEESMPGSVISSPIRVSPDGQWMLLEWNDQVAIIQNPLRPDQMVSTLSTFRLTSSCLPMDMQGPFDGAQFIVKDGVAWVLATCNCFLLWWDLSRPVGATAAFPTKTRHYRSPTLAKAAFTNKQAKYGIVQ